MKKKIGIFGSTGSIGKTLLRIVEKDRKNFEIVVLSADKNYKKLLSQANKYKVKNIIITNKKYYKLLKQKKNNLGFRIFNDFKNLNKIFNQKIDYIMSAITGIDGLEPTVNSIKYTKKIAIANKEAIICGWNLLSKEIKKNKTEFVPVDSEHFTIWYGIKNNKDEIDKLILTASGGPFLDLSIDKFKKINLKDALKHPNWKMGKKITIDSATMMNKVFEIIEAKKIFNSEYKKLSIVTHPNSYIHSLIKFKNGIIKIIAHDTNMKIPIFNSIYFENNGKKIKTNNINLEILNNLKLKKVDLKKFPVVKIINKLPKIDSLFETILVSANDELVKSFLNKQITFSEITKKLIKFVTKKEFKKYKLIQPKNVQEIIKLNKDVRLKINSKSI